MSDVFEGMDLSSEACPLPLTDQAPAASEVAALFARATTIAVVGASPRPQRTSHEIATWLMDHTPYEVFLVNPLAAGEEIRGHGFYDSIADLPVVPDIVDVFRRAEFTPAVATEAAVVGAGALWLQLGVINDEAMQIARASGLVAVENRCIKVEYARLHKQIEDLRSQATAQHSA